MELLTATVCVVAAVALGYRLVSCWADSGTLVHILGGLLIASVVLASVVVSLSPTAADTPAQMAALALILVHGILCVGVAWFWPALQFWFVVPLPRRTDRPRGQRHGSPVPTAVLAASRPRSRARG